MTLDEAMRSRHTVRRYTDRKLPGEVLEALDGRIQKNNREYGLAMNLVTENTEAFGPLLRLFLAKGVRHYVILAGRDRPGLDEAVGYCGADVMLFAQTLGLNSWWVGGTFRRKGLQKNAALIDQLYGEAVQFEHKHYLLVAHEGTQLLRPLGFIQREQGNGVADLFQLIYRRPAYSLGGGIAHFNAQFLLQPAQLVKEPVIHLVAHCGSV